MRRCLKRLPYFLALVCLLGSSLWAALPQGKAVALSNFSLYVKDERGIPRPDAWVVIRYRFGADIWQRVTAGKTGAGGLVVFQLDPREDYVVLVYYNDSGLEETWAYGYIGKEDWGDSAKTFYRNRPWISQIDMGPQPWIAGKEQAVTVTAAHGYRDMDYDFRVKIAMTVDDDGKAPYLAELESETQVFYTGIRPFNVSHVPTSEGWFLVRFVIYTKFEANDWEISDNSGWQWQVQAVRKVDAPALVRGQVYEDQSHDGRYTFGEPPISGVRLLLAQGTLVVRETVSGDQGQYQFSVPAGSYQLGIARAPNGYRVPIKRDITCEAGQVQSVDWALERWNCYVPLFLATYKP